MVNDDQRILREGRNHNSTRFGGMMRAIWLEEFYQNKKYIERMDARLRNADKVFRQMAECFPELVDYDEAE